MSDEFLIEVSHGLPGGAERLWQFYGVVVPGRGDTITLDTFESVDPPYHEAKPGLVTSGEYSVFRVEWVPMRLDRCFRLQPIVHVRKA